MTGPIKSSLKHTAIRLTAGVAATLLLVLCTGCGGSESSQPASPAEQAGGGFTFFGLGRNTVLSENIRDRLTGELGSGAVETRGTINLEITSDGLLPTHFPALNELNRRLNYPPRERVEHDIIRLMYRYARGNNLPFSYVELVFSGAFKKPLYFKIIAEKEGGYLVDTLRDKYGPAGTIDLPEPEERLFYWKRDEDVLVLAVLTDRYGDPSYRVMIYFGEHLNRLLEREAKARIQRRTESRQAGKTAF